MGKEAKEDRKIERKDRRYTPFKTRMGKTPAASDDFKPPTPNLVNKSENRQRLEEDEHPLARQSLKFDHEEEEEEEEEEEDGAELISFSETSPEGRLIEHLKQLTKMKPSLEKTDSLVYGYELLISNSLDSKFTNLWKEVGRGVKQLKEGLSIISDVQKLLCSPYTDNN